MPAQIYALSGGHRQHIEVTLSKRSKERIDTKIREMTPRTWGQSFNGCLTKLNGYLRGWINFFGSSCTEAVERTLHNLDAHIRRRLRALLLRQWKRKRFIVRRLIRMGARATKAWKTVYVIDSWASPRDRREWS